MRWYQRRVHGTAKTRLVPFCITALSPDFSEPRFYRKIRGKPKEFKKYNELKKLVSCLLTNECIKLSQNGEKGRTMALIAFKLRDKTKNISFYLKYTLPKKGYNVA